MHYRLEIDGSGVLVVVPVVLFHTRVNGFGGGFIGVDVFCHLRLSDDFADYGETPTREVFHRYFL